MRQTLTGRRLLDWSGDTAGNCDGAELSRFRHSVDSPVLPSYRDSRDCLRFAGQHQIGARRLSRSASGLEQCEDVVLDFLRSRSRYCRLLDNSDNGRSSRPLPSEINWRNVGSMQTLGAGGNAGSGFRGDNLAANLRSCHVPTVSPMSGPLSDGAVLSGMRLVTGATSAFAWKPAGGLGHESAQRYSLSISGIRARLRGG